MDEQRARYSASWIDGDLNLDNVWSVGGKLGFLATPRLLLYGVGGYTEARLDGSATATFAWGDAYKTVKLDMPDELKGWFVGGGAEMKLHKNVSLKLEYRYARYGSESVSASEHYYDEWTHHYDKYRLNTDVSAKADLDADIHSVRAALVLRLDDLHDRHHEPLK